MIIGRSKFGTSFSRGSRESTVSTESSNSSIPLCLPPTKKILEVLFIWKRWQQLQRTRQQDRLQECKITFGASAHLHLSGIASSFGERTSRIPFLDGSSSLHLIRKWREIPLENAAVRFSPLPRWPDTAGFREKHSTIVLEEVASRKIGTFSLSIPPCSIGGGAHFYFSNMRNSTLFIALLRVVEQLGGIYFLKR